MVSRLPFASVAHEAHAGFGALNVLGFRAGFHANAGLLEDALEFLRDFLVLDRHDARQHFEHGDLRAEAIEDGREFHADGARADDREGFGDDRHVENFDVGQDDVASALRPGSMRASEPVATMMFFVSSVCDALLGS